MLGTKFNLFAIPKLEGYCKCGNKLYEVSNGLLGKAWFCKKCENVYLLELRKVPEKKITKKYLEQCRKEA
jgi:hypothetical protein